MLNNYSQDTRDRISFMAIILLFTAISYFQYGFFKLCDDAFIYLQYTRNIINNGIVAFNDGTVSYGFTSPIWLLQFAGLGFFIKDLLIIPTFLSFLYALLYLIVFRKIVFSIVQNNYLRFSFLLLIALDPNLSKHSFLGLETTMVYFISAVLLFEIFINEKKNTFRIGILEAVAYLIRPDMLILISVINLSLLFRRKEKSKTIFRIILGSSIVLIPWFVFAYNYFGDLFPATYYAKGGDYPFGLRFFKNLYDSTIILGSSYFVAFGFIFWNLISHRNNKYYLGKNEIPILLIVATISYVLFYSLTLSNEFLFSRYFVIISPMIFLSIIKFIPDKMPSNKIKIFFLSALISFLIISFLHSTIYRKVYIESEKTEDELIEWVNENTAITDKIYRDRIGKIAFKTNRMIIDPVGLVNKEISQYKLSNNLKSFYLKTKPDYLLGPKKNELELFQRYFDDNVILVDSIKSRKNFLVRQILEDEMTNKVMSNVYLKIYKIDWNK